MTDDDPIRRRAQGAGRRSARSVVRGLELGPKKVSVATVKHNLAILARLQYAEMRTYEDSVSSGLDTAGRALFDAVYREDFAMRDLVEPPGWRNVPARRKAAGK